MAQHYLTVDGGGSYDLMKSGSMIKTYSFSQDEDEDEGASADDSPSSSDDNNSINPDEDEEAWGDNPPAISNDNNSFYPDEDEGASVDYSPPISNDNNLAPISNHEILSPISDDNNSFNLDEYEDEGASMDNSPQISDDNDLSPISSHNNLSPISNDNNLSSISSPSIFSPNQEDIALKVITLMKRKSRPKVHRTRSVEKSRPPVKETPWYLKLDVKRPLMIVGTVIFLYLMVDKRDIWMDRLLTSNTRIRQPVIENNEQKIKESTDSSSRLPKATTIRSSKGSLADSFRKEDTIVKTEAKVGVNNTNEGSTHSSPKSIGHQKLNIRLRRNKMSFSKEPLKKKHHYTLRNSSVDGNHDSVNEEDKDKLVKTTKSILSRTDDLTKKHNHQPIIEEDKSESPLLLESDLSISTNDDYIEQLRKNLKSQSEDPDFLPTLSKTIGLNKNKLYRFIYKKDDQVMTLQTFTSLLDSLNLRQLIVAK